MIINKPLTLVLNMTLLITNKDNSVSLFSLYKNPLNKLTCKRQHNEREPRKPSHPTIALNSRNQTATQWLVKYGPEKKDCMHHHNLSPLQIKYHCISASMHFAFRLRQTSLTNLDKDFLLNCEQDLKTSVV